MRIIIGYGNTLRGEDAFGVDVINQLQKYTLKDTKLICVFQLTPELCLELLEAEEIIFIDASYSTSLHYTLSCSLDEDIKGTNLSHHISPKIIISMLRDLYGSIFTYEIYSMTTCSFEIIDNKKKYEKCLDEVSSFIRESKKSS